MVDQQHFDEWGSLSPRIVARIAFAIFLGTFLINLFEVLVKRWIIPDTTDHQYELKEEIAALKREATTLNHPDTFAQSAKADRKAIALQKELDRLQQQEAYAKSHYLLRLPLMARGMGMAAVLFLSVEVPVLVYLPPKAVSPLGRWLAMGSGMPATVGAVGILPWALLSHRVTRAYLKA